MRRVIVALVLWTAALASAAPARTAEADDERVNLWPLYTYDRGEYEFLWPLGQYRSDEDWRLFPIIYTPPRLICVFPELWITQDAFGLLPFWLKKDFSEGTIFSLVWWNADDEDYLNAFLPFYWYGREGDSRATFWMLGGLVGWTRHQDRTTRKWIAPFWYSDDSRIGTPLWYHHRNANGRIDNWVCPPLLSWGFNRVDDDGANEFVTLIAGWTLAEDWVLPLYYRDDNSFLTLIYSWAQYGEVAPSHHVIPWLLTDYITYDDGDSSLMTFLYGRQRERWTYWFTPLIGTHEGEASGGWFFPFFNSRTDRTYDKTAALLDAERLPEDFRVEGRADEVGREATSSGSFLLLFDADRAIDAVRLPTVCKLTERTKHGNRVLFNRETTRTVTFDAATRERKSVRECSTTSFLWRVWRRHEEDGAVSISAFPGFLYDAKPDGTSKASLFGIPILW